MPGYSLKTTVASNLKNNWHRSITTITKYPSNKSTHFNSGGKKTATTKLNYGFHNMPLPNMTAT